MWLYALLWATLLKTPDAGLQSDDWQTDRQQTSSAVAASQQRIEVQNRLGDILVRVDDQPRLTVIAHRQWQGETPPQVRLEEAETSMRVSVVPAGGAPGTERIDLSLVLPSRLASSFETTAGRIEAKGVSDVDAASGSGEIVLDVRGRARASSETGSITAVVRDESSDGSLFESDQGEITLFLARELEALVEIESAGPITTDFSLQIDRPRGGPWKRAVARIGAGSTRIGIDSTTGAVRLLLRNP